MFITFSTSLRYITVRFDGNGSFICPRSLVKVDYKDVTIANDGVANIPTDLFTSYDPTSDTLLYEGSKVKIEFQIDSKFLIIVEKINHGRGY